MTVISRVAPKRKLVQWLSTLLMIALPFIKVGGESLIRLDAASRTILFFGASIRIEEFYLFLLAILILLFGFLFVTMVFGRVWCGWFCPQTTITHLAECIDHLVEKIPAGKFFVISLKQLNYLIISFLVAANLIWYFIPPGEFVSRFLRNQLGPVAGISLAAMIVLMYADIVFVRRYFCKSICPYGRIQLMTMDRNTLTLEFDSQLITVCNGCGSCERSCPVGIDIKKGLQIECINCGRCLDACRDVMANQGRGGLIHYTFGREEEGGGHPLNSKTLLLSVVLILLSIILMAGIVFRKEATIKIQRGGEGRVSQMQDGSVINFYTAYLENRAVKAGTYSLTVAPLPGYGIEMIGPVLDVFIQGNAHRGVD